LQQSHRIGPRPRGVEQSIEEGSSHVVRLMLRRVAAGTKRRANAWYSPSGLQFVTLPEELLELP
jgi:hypothetical protein